MIEVTIEFHDKRTTLAFPVVRNINMREEEGVVKFELLNPAGNQLYLGELQGLNLFIKEREERNAAER